MGATFYLPPPLSPTPYFQAHPAYSQQGKTPPQLLKILQTHNTSYGTQCCCRICIVSDLSK